MGCFVGFFVFVLLVVICVMVYLLVGARDKVRLYQEANSELMSLFHCQGDCIRELTIEKDREMHGHKRCQDRSDYFEHIVLCVRKAIE